MSDLTTERPKLLDLFCCAGGAGEGYYRAGFDVTGVDINPSPRYPHTFIQADALEFVVEHGHEYDVIHASPPCQGYTMMKTAHGQERPLLIPEVRELLEASGKPFVIENVKGAPMRRDLMLCGEMFGLRVIRHRYFESNVPLHQLDHIKHRGRVTDWRHGKMYEGPYFAVYGTGGSRGTVEQWQDAMGIDWTNVRREIAEAIPPAYTEYIGDQLMRDLTIGKE